ncbi:hypothetical protein BH10BAC5_BH10BAC5_01810 [soil metagenome]
MKRISTLGPSVLLAILAGVSYFLITDTDTKDFTSKSYTSLNMPYEMTQSFYKRTRYSDERVNLNRPPFIQVKLSEPQDKDIQLDIALCGLPVKERNVPLSTIMNLTPYVTPGNDPKSSYENYTKAPTTPPVVNSRTPQLPVTGFSFSYGYSVENKMDELSAKYDEKIDKLSNDFEASLDNIDKNCTVYKQLKTQYKAQINSLKLEYKRSLQEIKKVSDVQRNQRSEQKDTKGCNLKVEVLKVRNTVTPTTNIISRSKAVVTESSDSEDENSEEE